MDATAITVIQSMSSTVISFIGDIITNLWGLLLSLAILGAVGGWIYRKGFGRG